MADAVVVWARVTDTAITVSAHEDAVADVAAGAVVSFAGVVRNHDHGREVRELEYSAHPTAPAVITSVVAEVAASSPGVRAVAVTHRVGALTVGDVAFAVAVSADHRAAAFATCARLVDDVKAHLPVWKRQLFADGSDEWVGCA